MTIKSKEFTIEVPGGKIWAIKYYVESTKGKTPLLVLHGGPGVPHNYLLPVKELAEKRPVIFYDQLGCGKSEHPTDESLWRLPRFVAELREVVIALDLKSFYLFGHSWGGSLATEYASHYPEGIEKMILASPVLDTRQWIVDANRLREELPSDVQSILSKYEAEKAYRNPEYQRATKVFYQRHLCRLNPWPEELLYSFDSVAVPVYYHMWGPAEFLVTGNLEELTCVEDLAKFEMPVLLTCGRYDEATPESMEKFSKKLRQGEFRIFEQSSHMAMWEERDAFLNLLDSFCGAAEQFSETFGSFL